MCEAVGHRVKRSSGWPSGPLKLAGLAEGGHRRLSEAEIERLRGGGPPGARR
jgi:16S rRNA U516 pseudouridylate synthase RsuA-like enzyme